MKDISGFDEDAADNESECDADQFGDLTTWLWYYTHPGWPRDGISHTSDVCRSIARKVIEFLETLPEARPIKTQVPGD